MIFSLKKDILADSGMAGKAAAVLVVVFGNASGMRWTPRLRRLDKICGGVLSAATSGGYLAKSGDVCVLYPPTKAPYRRLIVVGRGEDSTLPTTAIEKATAALPATIKSLVLLCDKNAVAAAMAVAAGGYRYRLAAASPLLPPLQRVFVEGDVTARQLSRLGAVGEGVRLARHLGEQPGNICTPSYLAATAKRLARGGGLSVKVIERKEMERLGMRGLLAVSQGSVQPPKLIVLRHAPSKQAKLPPIVLVGKGITFDTGGISLKPGAAMDEMKFDMGGAASVFGTMLACAKMKLPLHVIGIVPSCENMPDGGAVKPGDVIRMMNGKTVEILNTDAEGRLILADALAYSARYKPAAVVDVATLTGACVIALGHVHSGMTANDDKLAKELLVAGRDAHDNCWRLPMGEAYDKLLKSDYADLANIGGRSAGTITAACFLSHFAACKSWAHLDIAGTAWDSNKRATGRPVPLLAQFLLNRVGG